MTRKLPGRIVGQTKDVDGEVGYVLTLSAREQHIRREKASSNICSNQALCAFAAGVYMAAMGEKGMKQCARLCTSKAHYFASELEKIGCTLEVSRANSSTNSSPKSNAPTAAGRFSTRSRQRASSAARRSRAASSGA